MTTKIKSGVVGDIISGQTEDTSPDVGADYVLTYDASGAAVKKVLLGRASASVITTPVATTSGTTVDISTTIPSWAKKIIISFNEVSGSGTSEMLVQIGDSGGFEVADYISSGSRFANASSIQVVSSTAGFLLNDDDASFTVTGHMILTLVNTSSNTWVSSHSAKCSTVQSLQGGGVKSLSGTLDRVRLTYANGTDTFDAGSVSLMYE
jgi:hypothetical protein